VASSNAIGIGYVKLYDVQAQVDELIKNRWFPRRCDNMQAYKFVRSYVYRGIVQVADVFQVPCL
jgi:hypothetical protein